MDIDRDSVQDATLDEGDGSDQYLQPDNTQQQQGAASQRVR